MTDRDRLADYAAHGCATNMRLADPEDLEKARRVVGHIIERIGASVVTLRGEARIPIVEPDDVMTPVREVLAEAVIPVDQLARKPADQKERPGRAVSEGFILDMNAISRCSQGTPPLKGWENRP